MRRSAARPTSVGAGFLGLWWEDDGRWTMDDEESSVVCRLSSIVCRPLYLCRRSGLDEVRRAQIRFEDVGHVGLGDSLQFGVQVRVYAHPACGAVGVALHQA